MPTMFKKDFEFLVRQSSKKKDFTLLEKALSDLNYLTEEDAIDWLKRRGVQERDIKIKKTKRSTVINVGHIDLWFFDGKYDGWGYDLT